MKSSIIRDQVIFGIRDLHVKEVLLRDGNITLEKVLEYCRAVEVIKQQIEEFQREASVNINVVKRKSVKRDVIDDCNFCGYSHRIRNCPAFGKECGFCKEKGHFVKKCLEFSKNKKNILEIQEDESEPDDHDCREDPNEHNSIDLYVSEVRKTQIERQQVWKISNDISIGEKLLFVNDKLIVPSSLKQKILSLLHENHFGENKTKARARSVFYWPKMSSEIASLVKNCKVCERYARNNANEPLLQPQVPSRPWERVAGDIMFYGNNDYMVVIDAYRLSPSQLLNNRRLRDKLPVHSGLLKQEGVNTEEVRRKLIKNQHVQKYYYDKKGVKNLPKVKEGDKIVIRKDGIWEPGTVIGEHQSPRSYIVEDDSGKILRRNRKLLKTSSSDFSKPSDESSEGSGRSEGRVSRTIRKPVRFDDYILS
ncbi:hypothetical protein JTB14_012628 [Gonioctena quinquepunctata]|nr:hypothetical protein JTB14_012628 [Gonioctena quinquepunctata]